MKFLLNLFNLNQLSSNVLASLGFVIVSSLLFVVIAIAYSISKKFIDTEFSKLKNAENNRFDSIIAIGFSAILSMVIVVVSILFIRVGLSGYEQQVEPVFSEHYCQLMVFFSVLLITTYALLSPNNEALRFFHFSTRESRILFRKLSRTVALSIAIIIIEVAISLLLHNDIANHCNYIFAVLITGYYFAEIRSAHAFMKRCLYVETIPDLKSLSVKLVMFINKKFPLILLIGMIAVITVNYLAPDSKVTFLEHLKDILCVLILMLVIQSTMSFVLSFVLDRLSKITVGKHSKRTVASRRKNLMWICDVLILFTYLSLMCAIPHYFGVDIKKYIFHDKIMIIAWVVFITVVIFRGFHEFMDTILEKGADRKDSTCMRLETFMPILSITFNIILFCTATLIGLSNLGIDIAPVLATFTVFSASVGLAAKDIIRSFLQGVVLLLEKDLHVGELVKINGLTGIVERVSARVIYLRDICGSLYIIPYSSIEIITNDSKDYANCFFGLHVTQDADIAKISELIIESVREVKEQDKDYTNEIVSDAAVYGLKAFDLSGPILEWGVKMKPGLKSKTVQYRVYTRLNEKFKKHNISIPIANLIMPSKI